MLLKKILIFVICLSFLLPMSSLLSINSIAAEMVTGIDFEQDNSCNFYGTDLSLFSTTYSENGRSAGLQAKDGSQISAYFNTGLSAQYANSVAIVFWLKAPTYANPAGDFANLNIGLICGDTRWKLNQSPTSGMSVTYLWSSSNLLQNMPLTSQGGSVNLDVPSGFEGWVMVPVDTLVKDWGPATSINLTGSTSFSVLWDWIPTADQNKMYYFDNIGFTTDINKYTASLKSKIMVVGAEFENNTNYNFYNVDSNSFSTTYKDMGRSISYTAKNGSQFEAYFNSNVAPQFKDSEAITLWLKAPTYADPSGDLANLNIGLVCGDNTRWKLNQSPTTGMNIKYIWSATNQVQNVPLASQGGVNLDVPSGFEGWVVIPLSTLVKDWGPATTIVPTDASAFTVVYEWIPTADIGKTYYVDSIGFTKNTDKFLNSLNAVKTNYVPKIIAVDLEQNADCSFSYIDLSFFTTDYKDTGRSAGLQAKDGSQIITNFDTSLSTQFENSNSIVFWLKTPTYANPSGDLPNLNIGLICGDTRWKLNQSPTTGMAVTFISTSTNEMQTVPLASQGGVYLDAPSGFEGFVIVPLNVLVKDWGPDTSIDLLGATSFNISWDWLPAADQNKEYYIDNVGFTKYIEGIDFEENGDCTFDTTDLSLFSTDFMNTGRSAGLKAKDGSQIIANLNTALSAQYTDSQAIVMWLKTPEYANPTGDLANLNIGLICGDTRWKLNQSPSVNMDITYVWSKDKLVQKVPLAASNGVFLDAPSNFEGWVIIPINLLQKDWGPGTSINLPGSTSFNVVWEWIPLADQNKMYYFDTLGFTKDTNVFIKSLDVTTDSTYILNEKVWRTPTIDKNGFVFEIQTMDGTADSIYNPATVRSSINNLKLGESKKIPCNATADEWENTYIFIDNGFQNPVPTTRQSALQMLQSYFNSNYINSASHLWKAFDGNFLNQHYSAEFGADILGAEIGCDIKSYQMSIAYTRGAAKQYGKPWFIDYSPWYNSASITDYSGAAIWGDSSGPNKGHTISQFERSYYMSYMSGASWLIAEAGGINYFYPTLDSSGNYNLTPHGKMGQKFNAFTKNNPDIGVPYTPFGVVIDYYHGTSFGSDYAKKAFEVFPYNSGDNLTWSLIDKFFPDSWTAWGRKEAGSLTNSPYGDTCDVLLQNASQEVLNSYPVITLSGDITFSTSEIARIKNYVTQGGKLVINSAYLSSFPEFVVSGGGNRYDKTYGNGVAMVYGPDYDPTQLDGILSSLTTQYVPFSVSGHVQYIVNIKNGSMIITVINNDGVTKEADGLPIIDTSKTQTIDIGYRGAGTVRWVKDLRTGQMLTTSANQTVTLAPGELAVYEFGTVTVAPVPVTGVTLNKSTTSIQHYSTDALTATIAPSNATNKNVAWSSSNTAVATVSTSGVVTAVAATGTATITATTVDSGKTATCAVTVTPVPVTGVTLDNSTVSIGKQVTKQFTATVSPANADNKSLTWWSSNTSVATVSSSGLITAIAVGTATITATTVDGAFTATCAVTVTRYDATRYYKISYSPNTNLVMDCTGSTSGSIVSHVTYNSATQSQQWQIIEVSSGTFKIINKNNGFALDVTGGANSTNKNIIASTYVSSNRMNWTITDSTSYVKFNSKLGTNTYIKGTGTSGATLVTAGSSTSTSQRWVITLIP